MAATRRRAAAGAGGAAKITQHSATHAYQTHRKNSHQSSTDYLRKSTPDNDLRHTLATLTKARSAIEDAKALFPDTVRYSLHYDDWVSRSPTDLWELDAHGVATTCGSRMATARRAFDATGKLSANKCSSPNLDCADCRAYAQALGSYVFRQREFSADPEDFAAWIGGLQLWFELFMPLADQRGG